MLLLCTFLIGKHASGPLFRGLLHTGDIGTRYQVPGIHVFLHALTSALCLSSGDDRTGLRDALVKAVFSDFIDKLSSISDSQLLSDLSLKLLFDLCIFTARGGSAQRSSVFVRSGASKNITESHYCDCLTVLKMGESHRYKQATLSHKFGEI